VAIAGATTGGKSEGRGALHVPFVDLKVQAKNLHDEYEAAIWSVIDRAAYTMGPELERFEDEFAGFCGCAFGVGVSSGTDALKLALLGAGVQPGDEVVVPANTFIATAEAVSHVGARPVFVDCLEGSGLIDPAQVAAAVTPRTTAIVPVHLYGQPCDMDAIIALAAARGLAVVEDACQAHGARYQGRPVGSFGAAAAFSFYPGKNLGALGDGGAVTTNDPAVAERVRLYRNHGQVDKHTHKLVGYCDRLHNLQAALLSVKLRYLPMWNEARRAAARDYDGMFAGINAVTPTEVAAEVEAVFHLYVVRVERRDTVRDYLGAVGVESGIHYPVPLHLQPAYEEAGRGAGAFPVAERRARTILSLPMFPEIEPAQRAHVVESLDAALVQ
jgi:dTDP-4-amino-4,6-dideoxygalactose transaminase